MKLSENLEYTLNFALPTGRPEITEILDSKRTIGLLKWEGTVNSQTHEHTHTY